MLEPVAAKLGKLVRLLSSDKDGEVLATVEAIKRTLQNEGADFHELAENIAAGKQFSESDAKEIYQRAYQRGRDEAAAEHGFRSVDGDDDSTWHEIACECGAHLEKLRNDVERQFVLDMQRRTARGGTLTDKQEKWLRDCYVRVRR